MRKENKKRVLESRIEPRTKFLGKAHKCLVALLGHLLIPRMGEGGGLLGSSLKGQLWRQAALPKIAHYDCKIFREPKCKKLAKQSSIRYKVLI